MANKKLIGKYWNCPDYVLKEISNAIKNFNGNKKTQGYTRAQGILNNKKIRYEQMKRIKNYFDTYSGDGNDPEFILNGGKIMNDWVNRELYDARASIDKLKKIQSNTSLKNEYRPNRNENKVYLSKVRDIYENYDIYQLMSLKINDILKEIIKQKTK